MKIYVYQLLIFCPEYIIFVNVRNFYLTGTIKKYYKL